MGVWHLSGMGTSPGAITVPLTYLYLLLKASIKEDSAKRFFETSGEFMQELKGGPEGLIIFTSEEVITGKKLGSVKDNWFYTKEQASAPKFVAKYLSNLLSSLKDKDFSELYDDRWIREIYLVKVRHDNFDDCFFKAGVTLNALRDKEVWVNMIGGTNQINLALLSLGTYFASVSRYYYIFQSDISLLHPEIRKPDMKNPREEVPEMRAKWNDLPLFHLETGSIIKRLNEMFQERKKINLSEVENLLEELGYSQMYISKLRGKLIMIERDIVTPGPMLGKLADMLKAIEELYIRNLSQWKKWASENKILYELTLDGRCELK